MSDAPSIDAPQADPPARAPLGRRFLTVWAGQSLSQLGSNLAGVGIGVWVFLETGSAAWLGVLVALANVSSILVAPLMRYVDRWPRRHVMIWGDVVASLGTVMALVLAATDRLEVWHLTITVFVGGLGSALQAPAFQAAIPSLVGPDALGRANGLNQFGPALGIVVGPALGTPIAAWWGLEALLFIDLVSFSVAIVSTVVVSFGGRAVPVADADDDGSLTSAVRWLRTTGRALVTLIAAMAFINFVLSAFNVSMVTLAVTVVGPARAGLVLGAGGFAMLLGSVLLGVRGVPKRRVRSLAFAVIATGVGCFIAASRPVFALLVIGIVVGLVAVPAVSAAISTVFHERVPDGLQGRVFGIRSAVAQSLGPAGSLVGGFVITHAAAPAMASDAWAGRTVGRLIGAGPERGAALVLLGVGLALVLLGVSVARSWINAEIDGEPVSSTDGVSEPVSEPGSGLEAASAG